ncbi:hypothetical protein Y023_5117 [Burkholderia pseudomallei A79D]|nr:hypothetical protein Y023_5117 [Burkholderia pseudomallei A79D]KGX97346.1 hypothetical protein X997_4800 [Burkholderia pseudomallei A79C]
MQEAWGETTAGFRCHGAGPMVDRLIGQSADSSGSRARVSAARVRRRRRAHARRTSPPRMRQIRAAGARTTRRAQCPRRRIRHG